MGASFIAVAAGEVVARTEAEDRAAEHDALRILTAKALLESERLGIELDLVAAWPDCAVRVGRVEGDKVTWALGADGRVWA
jgi:hypothetical protein